MVLLRVNNKVDINTILQWVNCFLLALSIFFFVQTVDHPYVDNKVMIITALVHLQLAYFLFYEKRNSNPFLIILSLVVILFYLLRIFTIQADELMVSLTFTREGAESIGSKEFFIFMSYLFFGLWVVFKGLTFGDKKKYRSVQSASTLINPQKYGNLLVISFLCVIYFLIAGFVFNTDSGAGLLVGLMSGFFNYEVFVMLLTILVFHFKNNIPSLYRKTAIALLVLFFFFKIINGGSGPLLRIGFPFFFTLLMVKEKIRINVILFFVIVILVGVTSIFGTYTKFSNQKFNFGLVKSFQELEKEQFQIIFSQIAARSAFLDFSVELISNKEYERIININRYGKSLVDAYTPGFDVFDEPLSSYALRGVYLPSFPSKPTRLDVDREYHSDQINAFSEYYILFGPIMGLVFLYLTALFFKKAYLYFTSFVKNTLIGLLVAAVLLNLFWFWLRSFGLDFIVAELPSSIYPLLFISLVSRLKFRNAVYTTM